MLGVSARLCMNILKGVWRNLRYLACIACFTTAIFLFQRELNRPIQKPESSAPQVRDLAYRNFYLSIVSHVMRELGKRDIGKGLEVELVDCRLVRWFATSQHLVLTRNHRAFSEDDNFAHRISRIVFGRSFSRMVGTDSALLRISSASKDISSRSLSDTA